MSCDSLSHQFLGALPTPRDLIEPDDFRDRFTTYLGAPSARIAPLAGKSIPCGKGARTCDPMGFELGLASLDDGWDILHDELGMRRRPAASNSAGFVSTRVNAPSSPFARSMVAV